MDACSQSITASFHHFFWHATYFRRNDNAANVLLPEFETSLSPFSARFLFCHLPKASYIIRTATRAGNNFLKEAKNAFTFENSIIVYRWIEARGFILLGKVASVGSGVGWIERASRLIPNDGHFAGWLSRLKANNVHAHKSKRDCQFLLLLVKCVLHSWPE